MNDATCLKDKKGLFQKGKHEMSILQHNTENYTKINSICGTLLMISIVSGLGLGTAYAQSLEEVNANVLDFDGTFATIEISWNDDRDSSYYEAGCVSCMPNLSYTTTENSIIISNITPLADGNTLLYVLAYDDINEIISVKQIVIQLPK